MSVEDRRGTWTCALCREGQLPRSGMLCHPCELELDHGPRQRQLEDADYVPRSMGRPVENLPTGELF